MGGPFGWHLEAIDGIRGRHDSAYLTWFLWMNWNPEQAFCLVEAFGLELGGSNSAKLHGSKWHRASTRVPAMKTLINALLIGSLMTTVAFAGDAPKADKTAPAKKDDKAAAKTDDKAAATPTTDKKTDAKTDAKTDKKTDAKTDAKKPATK
jgi:hypothetical protein